LIDTQVFEYVKHCNARRLGKAKSIFELSQRIKQKPLQKKNFIALAKKFKFTDKQSARILGMSLRTFRKKNPTSDLKVHASEMVIRLSELYEIGLATFSNPQLFILWLDSICSQLNNHKPTMLIDSSIGVKLVKEQLLMMQFSSFLKHFNN
jgi:uncharacterized protein (DUF2384 family)